MTQADMYTVLQLIANAISGIGGNTIYSGDGTLTDDRTADLNGKVLKFQDSGNDLLTIDPANAVTSITAKDNGAGSSATFGVNGAGLFAISADDNTNPVISIIGNGPAQTATYTAGTHEFVGDVNVNGAPVGTSSLANILAYNSDGGANGMSNIRNLSMSPGVGANFLYMYSADGTPWIVTIANDGTLSIVADV